MPGVPACLLDHVRQCPTHARCRAGCRSARQGRGEVWRVVEKKVGLLDRMAVSGDDGVCIIGVIGGERRLPISWWCPEEDGSLDVGEVIHETQKGRA